MGQNPSGIYDNTSLFWQHEILHRNVIKDYQTFHLLFARERDDIENKFINSTLSNLKSSREKRKKISDQCFIDSKNAESHWLNRIKKSRSQNRQKLLHKLAWKKFNKQAKIIL